MREGWFAGPAPLGYLNRWRDGVSWIERDEDLAPLIQQAFYLIVCTRLSLRAVHREMTRRGLRNKKGKPLSFSAFQLMITNPFYCGKIRYQGKVYQGKHQPMISEELFEMAQKKIRSGKLKP